MMEPRMDTVESMAEAASSAADESLMRNFDTSLESYSRWMEEEPTNTFVLHHMGMLIEEELRTPEGLAKAEDLYRRALAANNNNIDALVSLASLLTKDTNRRPEALKLFEAGMELPLGKTRPRLLKNYAILLKNDTATEEKAKFYFMKCSDLDKHNASVYITLADMHEKADVRLAKNYLDLACSSDPDNNLVHSKLGGHHEKLGEYNNAAEYYRNAIKIDKNQHKQWFQLGRVYETIFAKSFCKNFPTEVPKHHVNGKPNTMSPIDLYFDAYRTESVDPVPKEKIRAMHGFGYLLQAVACYKRALLIAKEQKMMERTGALRNRLKAVRKRFPWVDDEPAVDLSGLMQPHSTRTKTFLSSDHAISPQLSNLSGDPVDLLPCLTTPISGMKCIRGHPMRRVSHKPPTYSRLATWACEECHLSIGGIERSRYGAFYCPICKYDLCYACTLKPRCSHYYADAPKEIGHGGMGKIMKVFDPFRGAYSAVKVIFNAKKAVLEREVQCMQKCKDPNVVTVYKENPFDGLAGQDGGMSFAMELMAGSLQDVLNLGPVHENIARQWICDALCALVSLKKNGIFHRDIKPANILLSIPNSFPSNASMSSNASVGGGSSIGYESASAASTSPTTLEEYPPLTKGSLDANSMKLTSLSSVARRVKLADFGICTEADPHFLSTQQRFGPASAAGGTRHTRFAGTDFYASPESQDTLDPKVNHKSDVYSLGVAWYAVLTGCAKPYDNNGNLVFTFPITDDCKNIIKRMIQKSPHDRPNAEDVLSYPYFRHIRDTRSDTRSAKALALDYILSKSNEGVETLEQFTIRRDAWVAQCNDSAEPGALAEHTVAAGSSRGTATRSSYSMSSSSSSSESEYSDSNDSDLESELEGSNQQTEDRRSKRSYSSTGKSTRDSNSAKLTDSGEVAALKKRVAELEARVASLEKENAELRSSKFRI
eukprot:GILI01010571.1.p1 GENE.GILI01010571.1~~GILI01010571.1.p1  ORF type:complete len:941 (-),score=128.59 GILI01010571.1:233-3055(-)